MIGVFGGLHGFQEAHPLENGTRDAPCALFGAVLKTKLQRIHAQLLAYFVYHRFGGEGRGGHTRGPVGGCFGLVHHYVITFDSAVGDVVWPHHALAGLGDGRAGESACLVSQGQVGGGYFSFLVGP